MSDTAMASALDRAVQASLPVYAAPIEGVLSPQLPGTRRLVVANDGLYLSATSPVMEVVMRIGDAYTPYGEVAEGLSFIYGPIPRSIFAELVRLAKIAATVETAAVVIADVRTQSYVIERPRILSCSAGEVTYDESAIDRSRLVIDMHSHGSHDSFFSETDDISDMSRMGPHISLVIGRCDDADVTCAARVVVPPYTAPIDVEACFE